MIIEIPRYRARSRNKTATSHWRVYSAHKKELAELVNGYKPRGAKTLTVPAHILIEAHYKGKRHVDTSNLDDKIIVDALMVAKIIKDDTAHDNPEVIKRCYPESGEDKIVIKINEIHVSQSPY